MKEKDHSLIEKVEFCKVHDQIYRSKSAKDGIPNQTY